MTGLTLAAWVVTSSWRPGSTSPGLRHNRPVNTLEVTWPSHRLYCKRGFIRIKFKIYLKSYLFRQIDFLSELAVLEGGFTGIGYWYIGLTDLGRFRLKFY